MSKTSVSLTWDMSKINGIQNKTMKGLLRMGYDMANMARSNAPYKTGALSNSIRVEENGETVEVIAGGRYANKNIKYAAIQEFGGNAGQGRKAHITGKHYMERAKNHIMSGNYLQKYFGEIV